MSRMRLFFRHPANEGTLHPEKITMFKYLLVILVLLNILSLKAQNSIDISIKNSTLGTTGNQLPFWFSANQHGKIGEHNSFLNVNDLFIGKPYSNPSGSVLSYTWGGNLVAAFGENNYYQVNQAFAGISFRGWELKGGVFHDPVRHAGLSTTNGNLARSRHARPYPMLRFSTAGYKPVPYLENWLSFKGEYDEGILNDKRYVDKTRMHHKSFYLKMMPSATWEINAGIEHFVMWGGTSPDEHTGELPKDFNAYLRYVFSASGDEDFPTTDQLNVAGNQLGTYQLEVVKNFAETDVAFYLSHPFEDLSGINWRNWPDKLLGLHLRFNNRKELITDVVYEFTNTRQQGIRDSIYVPDENTGEWKRLHTDNYFSHSVYKSGYTYHQQVMASPLFFPVILNDGISRGIRSNRFFAHHLGLRGNFSEFIQWKGLLTLSHHFGTYSQPFEPSQKQLSGLLEIQYINPGVPVEIGVSTGADAGNTIHTNLGFQLWVAKRW